MSLDPGIKADLHRYHKLSPTFPTEKGGCTGPPKKGSIIETCTTFKTPVTKREWVYIKGVHPSYALSIQNRLGNRYKEPHQTVSPNEIMINEQHLPNGYEPNSQSNADPSIETQISDGNYKTRPNQQIGASDQTHNKGLYDRARMLKRNQTIEKKNYFPKK